MNALAAYRRVSALKMLPEVPAGLSRQHAFGAHLQLAAHVRRQSMMLDSGRGENCWIDCRNSQRDRQDSKSGQDDRDPYNKSEAGRIPAIMPGNGLKRRRAPVRREKDHIYLQVFSGQLKQVTGNASRFERKSLPGVIALTRDKHPGQFTVDWKFIVHRSSPPR